MLVEFWACEGVDWHATAGDHAVHAGVQIPAWNGCTLLSDAKLFNRTLIMGVYSRTASLNALCMRHSIPMLFCSWDLALHS